MFLLSSVLMYGSGRPDLAKWTRVNRMDHCQQVGISGHCEVMKLGRQLKVGLVVLDVFLNRL